MRQEMRGRAWGLVWFPKGGPRSTFENLDPSKREKFATCVMLQNLDGF